MNDSLSQCCLCMALHLYNTLSGKIEEFRPLEDNEVRMYACGLTVYDYGHIGNFRTFIAIDVLHRFLVQSGYQVRHVMNITDVDDKIIRNSSRAGIPVKEYTAKFERAFLEDTITVNIEQPIFVRATDDIQEMAKFSAELERKGFAYRTEDGSYYFRIAKTKSRNLRHSPASHLPIFGFTRDFCWSKAKRCPKAWAIFLPCATWF